MSDEWVFELLIRNEWVRLQGKHRVGYEFRSALNKPDQLLYQGNPIEGRWRVYVNGNLKAAGGSEELEA